jgi:hypothetical protein
MREIMPADREGQSAIPASGGRDVSPQPAADCPAAWRAPTVRIIDIKRTLFLAGSGSDLSGRSTS